jgi:hypothetical protein
MQCPKFGWRFKGHGGRGLEFECFQSVSKKFEVGVGSLNVDKPKGHSESKASLNVQLGWNTNPIGTDAI